MSDMLSHLVTRTVAPGWDGIGPDGNYMVCRGKIKRGRRLARADNEGAVRLIEEVERLAPGWAQITLGRSRKNEGVGVSWPVYPLGDDPFGVSADLAALATRTVGLGEWRKGKVRAMPNAPYVVVKVRKGEVVAIIAPCRVRP